MFPGDEEAEAEKLALGPIMCGLLTEMMQNGFSTPVPHFQPVGLDSELGILTAGQAFQPRREKQAAVSLGW